MTISTGWRPLVSGDLPAVAAIAQEVHPAFPEDGEIFAERQHLYPQGASILEIDGTPAGYAISHPWHLGRVPELNALLGAIPADAGTYYLHDLALLPKARGRGAAGVIVGDLMQHARDAGFDTVSLVAVNDSMPFWRKHGFGTTDVRELEGNLAGYGNAARLMIHQL